VIVNDYVLRELNRQRRAQVADNLAALRTAEDHRRRQISPWRRRSRRAPTAQPVTTAVAYGTGWGMR
jgi:hypothetical protein